MEKHEYLLKENYYEYRRINKGRTDKICEHCGEIIKIGTLHDVHKFFDDDGSYPSYPTHINCSELFKESLL